MKKDSALILFVVMMLLHMNTGRAANSLLKKSNTTTITNECSGNLQKCLTGDVYSEELLMEYLETSNNLGKFLSLNSNKPRKPALSCGNGKQYRSCPSPQKNKFRSPQHCNFFTRRC